MRVLRYLIAACLSLRVALLVEPALATESADPDVLFNKGLADMLAGRYASGCPAIAESLRIDPRPGALFTLAECEMRQGKIASALDHYKKYLVVYEGLPAEEQTLQVERAKISRGQELALRARVPWLAVTLKADAPKDTVVKFDGGVLPKVALGVEHRVEPGEHVLSIEAPGRPRGTIRISLKEGEKKRVKLGVEPPSPTPMSPVPRSKGRRVATYTALGVGLAGVAVGAITGGLALGKKSVIEANCSGTLGTACTREGKDAADDAQSLATASTVGFGVGIAGLVTTVVLIVSEPKQKALDANARRVKAGMLSVTSQGAVFGVEGSF